MPITMPTVIQAALDPNKCLVMAKKVLRRFSDYQSAGASANNVAWIRANCRDFASYATKTDSALWTQALAYSETLETRADEILSTAGVRLGGGGFYPMLYFLARHRKPEVILETGVAAGYSSQVLLKALDLNGKGALFSSDFPYFRLANPEKYIGILVEERLKSRWHLYTKGDEANLPLILRQLTQIDLFHYDSDKSYSGRSLAMSRVMPKMAQHGVIVMDDIQDNTFFKNYIETKKITSFSIFEFQGKYVGVIEIGDGSFPAYQAPSSFVLPTPCGSQP